MSQNIEPKKRVESYPLEFEIVIHNKDFEKQMLKVILENVNKLPPGENRDYLNFLISAMRFYFQIKWDRTPFSDYTGYDEIRYVTK